MKVRRYPAGRTNVDMLQSQRQGAISPEEGAAAAAAPYQVVADIAGSASDILVEHQKNKNMALDVDDAATAELNFAMAEAQRKITADRAKTEKWSAEREQEEMDAISQNFLGTSELISERNRSEYERKSNVQVGLWQFQNASNFNMRKFEQSVVKTDSAVNLALEGRDFTLAANITRTAIEDGRYSKEAGEEQLRKISDVELGYDLFEQYKKAAEADETASFMAGMSEDVYSPETLNVFSQEKSLYDSQMKEQKAIEDQQEREVKDRAYLNYKRSIEFAPISTVDDLKNYATTYSDDNLHDYADSMDLPLSHREALFNARDRHLQQIASAGNKKQGGPIEPDLTSKNYRDYIDTQAVSELGIDPSTATPEQRDQVVRWEVDNAKEFGAIGTTTANFLNSSATGGVRGSTDDGWVQFLKALPVYERLQSTDNVVWEGVDSKNTAMYESVRYLNYENNPDMARQVWTNYRSASQDELDKAKAQYNTQDLIAVLQSDEDLATRAGLIRADSWLWFNTKPDIPGATQAQINRIGETLAIQEALTSGVVNYSSLAEKVANVMGTIVTTSTLNEGAPSGNDSLGRISEEMLLYPPVTKEGETWARGVLAQDMLPVDSEPWKVVYNNTEYTIGAAFDPSMEDEARMDMGEGIGTGLSETLPDPYADIPGNVIPVNMIQIVTPPLRQNQFNEKGERIWNLYYRGKMLMKPDYTAIEWTPFEDTEGRVRQMEESVNAP
jgi:hypothetical protein